MTKQIETLAIVGTITTSGNAEVIVTANGLTGSPVTLSVAVLEDDVAADVAQKVRVALALHENISAMFLASGAGANVILTRREHAANDATLNIAIDNDTCVGLTAVPTSTNTTAGASAETYYITLAEFKQYRRMYNADETTDDDLILRCIAAGQGDVEDATAKVFKASSDTDRGFTPGVDTDGLTLKFDKYIASITSITNGDGASIAADDYITIPRDAPYIAVRLKSSSGVLWTYGAESLEAITVTGRWAYSVTPSAKVKEAVQIAANYRYQKASQPGDSEQQIITPEGIVLPTGLRKMIYGMMKEYMIDV